MSGAEEEAKSADASPAAAAAVATSPTAAATSGPSNRRSTLEKKLDLEREMEAMKAKIASMEAAALAKDAERKAASAQKAAAKAAAAEKVAAERAAAAERVAAEKAAEQAAASAAATAAAAPPAKSAPSAVVPVAAAAASPSVAAAASPKSLPAAPPVPAAAVAAKPASAAPPAAATTAAPVASPKASPAAAPATAPANPAAASPASPAPSPPAAAAPSGSPKSKPAAVHTAPPPAAALSRPATLNTASPIAATSPRPAAAASPPAPHHSPPHTARTASTLSPNAAVSASPQSSPPLHARVPSARVPSMPPATVAPVLEMANAPNPSAPGQLSSLGLLLGLKGAPPGPSAPAHAHPPLPTLTLLPPPPSAIAFPSLPSLFTSRRSDGRRQGIMLNVKGGGGMDMRQSLAAFRAQLGKGGEGADPGSDDDDEEEEEEEEEKKSAAKAGKKSGGHHHAHHGTHGAHGTHGHHHAHGAHHAQGVTPAASGTAPAGAVKRKVVGGAVTAPAAAPVAPQPVKVKVVMKGGAKSLPATSLAGISAQQAALQAHAVEEKTNHGAATARSGPTMPHRPAASNIGRIGATGGGGPGLGFVEASNGSCIPLSLPKTANLLQFIPTESLRSGLSGQDQSKLFEFYAGFSAGPGEAKDRLRKEDLLKLAGDILERLRRMLGEEMRAQGLSASSIPQALDREMEFVVRGKNEEERKQNLVGMMVAKVPQGMSSSSGGGGHKSAITKAAFLQVWGEVSKELFTVRQDGALGCVIC